MSKYSFINVSMWGHPVGVLLHDDVRKTISFEFEESFLHRGLNISPIRLPLKPGQFSFPDLGRSPAFQGLAGIFADSLPDKFGQTMLRSYFLAKGIAATEIPLFAKLLYIGSRSMGALEYTPEEKLKLDAENIDIEQLLTRSRRVLMGDVRSSSDQIFRYGGTAGGARAKAIIRFNPTTNQFTSPFAPDTYQDPNSSHWLIKFDGVDPEKPHLQANQAWERVEYIYNVLAREAGLKVPEFAKIEEHGRFHFLVKRFDREGDEKIHMATFGGLRHLDFNHQQSVGYESLLKTIRNITGNHRDVEEMFSRVVFNVAMQNMDDHVKNHSFLMDRTGSWSLSPLYDVVFTSRSADWFSKGHQLSVNGKFDHVSREDLLIFAKQFQIKQAVQKIDRILETCSLTNVKQKLEEHGVAAKFPNITGEILSAITSRRALLEKVSDKKSLLPSISTPANLTPEASNAMPQAKTSSDHKGCRSGANCVSPNRHFKVRRMSGYCWYCHKTLGKP